MRHTQDNVRGAGIIVKMINSNLALSSHLFSVSGSGKTRLSLDGLCSHWGLYISCRTMADTASGSNDFKATTDMLQTMSDWGTSSPDLSNYSPVAHRAFTMLLCARVFILCSIFLLTRKSRMRDGDGSLLKFCLLVYLMMTSLSKPFGVLNLTLCAMSLATH